MKTAKAYRVVCHGIENSQYFQGHGLSFSKFADTATGIGDTALEAFEDALASLAQNDWDVESLRAEITKDGQLPTGGESVSQWIEANAENGHEPSDYDSELYWYVSVDVSAEEV